MKSFSVLGKKALVCGWYLWWSANASLMLNSLQVPSFLPSNINFSSTLAYSYYASPTTEWLVNCLIASQHWLTYFSLFDFSIWTNSLTSVNTTTYNANNVGWLLHASQPFKHPSCVVLWLVQHSYARIWVHMCILVWCLTYLNCSICNIFYSVVHSIYLLTLLLDTRYLVWSWSFAQMT